MRHATGTGCLAARIASAVVLAACLGPARAAEGAQGPDAKGLARQILEATGVQGGLVVHLGCGDGALTAALRADERYVVHGLDRDADHVAQARAHIHALGLDGTVAVARSTGQGLPYIDGLANLVVADDPGKHSCVIPSWGMTSSLTLPLEP